MGTGVNSIAEGVGRFAMSSFGVLQPLPRKQLISGAMYRISEEAFHGYRVIVSVGLPVIAAIEVGAAGLSAGLGIALALLLALTSWMLFGSVVRRRSERRLSEIDRELPELIDVLIATIEAGLGFAGSLALVSSRIRGPLGEELRLALQEQQMGLSTNRALSNILERSDTPSMRSFVRAVLQGETFGVSIGVMLRNLAIEMRARRRHTAQERVQQAPLKMLFPLVFLIFPAMLIVLLYPAVHELLRGFSNL